MKPELYYQTDNQGTPLWDFCASAWIGAKENKITTTPFIKAHDIIYNPYKIVVGSVEETLKYLNKEIKPINRTWAKEFEKREIKTGYIKDIPEHAIFIKPAEEIKGFTGSVVFGKKDVENYIGDYKNKILIQEVKSIKTGYRVYISLLRGIIGVKHYLGCPYTTLDQTVVYRCWEKSKENLKELSYTLDFGVDYEGETFLIEVNDGWAIGNYGLDSSTYYNFIKNRFLQLTGVLK